MLLTVFLSISLATVVLPGILVVTLVVNALVGLFLSFSQVAITFFPEYKPRRRKTKEQPFVSVLVPTYNEPPPILMQTLEALSRLRYENYEVVVIDNNTQDPAVWKPIERYAAALGNKVIFVHVEGLDGYKAGALNYGMERVHPETKYIAVVDADYVVEPDFLTIALSYFTRRDIALVQFPQEYRNVDASNQPIADEYKHFFRTYMNMANHLDCVPSTGTLSVYGADALRAVKGFHTEALTEDADVGLRFGETGFRGVYVDRTVGRGFMPYDIEAYQKQKQRWALGNAQSIKVLFSVFGKIRFRSWLGYLIHLTAWDHFLFLPYAVLAGFVVVATPLVQMTPAHAFLLDIVFTTIFATLLAKFTLLLATLQKEERSLERAVQALIVHMGLTLFYSGAFIKFLFKDDLRFERTNKFVFREIPSLLKNTYRELLLGSWMLLGAAASFMFGSRFALTVLFFIVAMVFFSVYYVYWSIRSTRAVSRKMLRDIERGYEHHFLTIS